MVLDLLLRMVGRVGVGPVLGVVMVVGAVATVHHAPDGLKDCGKEERTVKSEL